jgi:hypothetical protein
VSGKPVECNVVYQLDLQIHCDTISAMFADSLDLNPNVAVERLDTLRYSWASAGTSLGLLTV